MFQFKDIIQNTRIIDSGYISEEAPKLAIVVDTEEEFDWSKPFDQDNTSTKTIELQDYAHEIYTELDIKPTYVIDYCVATNQEAINYLKNLLNNKQCEIGAHLHPWINPPIEEEINNYNSFHGNLPKSLEEKKINLLTKAIHENFHIKPIIFKAGRYGIGKNTLNLIAKNGYKIDCSFVPYTSFQSMGGPSYLHCPNQPFWIRQEQGDIFEAPLTKGFSGIFSAHGHLFQLFFDKPWAQKTKIVGILSQLHLLERSNLTPEGISYNEQKKLIDQLIAHGKKYFCLTYHSPSLGIGCTPYVKTAEDRKKFLLRIKNILSYFKQIGGEFTTLSKIYQDTCSKQQPLS